MFLLGRPWRCRVSLWYVSSSKALLCVEFNCSDGSVVLLSGKFARSGVDMQGGGVGLVAVASLS